MTREEAKEALNDLYLMGEINKKIARLRIAPTYDELFGFARYFFELGQKDAANKYDEIEYNRQRAQEQEGQR